MHVAPRTLNTWIAGLFVVGSALFVVGSVPAYIHAVPGEVDAATYAVGSVFFTAAALAQLVQAQDPALTTPAAATDRRPVAVPRWHWRPHDRGWAAAATQFPGTLCFNVSTFAALAHNLSAAEQDHRVWRPDIYGSVLFLVASALGVLAIGRVRSLRPRSAAWWTAWLNLLGSVAFMASALASFVLPDTDELLDVPVSVGGTLIGALCFLVGAALLPLGWRQELTTPHEGAP